MAERKTGYLYVWGVEISNIVIRRKRGFISNTAPREKWQAKVCLSCKVMGVATGDREQAGKQDRTHGRKEMR